MKNLIMLFFLFLLGVPLLFSQNISENLLKKNEEPLVNEKELKILDEAIKNLNLQPEASISLLKKTITGKSSAALDFALASIYFERGDLEKASIYYKSTLKKKPNFMRARGNLARVLLCQEKFDEAILEFKEVLLYGVPRPSLYTMLGYCYLLNEDVVAAETAYRQAILFEAKDLNAYLGLGKCLLAQARFNEAILLLNEILKRDSSRREIWLLLANSYLSTEQYSKAIETLESARYLKLMNSESLATLGDLYLNQEMYEESLKAYEEIFSDSYNDINLMLRGIEALLKVERDEEALVLTQKIDALQVPLTQGQKDHYLFLKAKIAFLGGKYDEAIDLTLDLLKKEPLHNEALILLGELYSKSKKYDLALMAFERVQGGPRFRSQSLLKQAQIEVERQHFNRAYELLNEAYTLRPEKYIRDYMGQLEHALREF